jgi:hypothetical protein
LDIWNDERVDKVYTETLAISSKEEAVDIIKAGDPRSYFLSAIGIN